MTKISDKHLKAVKSEKASKINLKYKFKHKHDLQF